MGSSTCVASFHHAFSLVVSVEKKGSKHLNVEYLHEEVSLSVMMSLRLTSRLEESYLVLMKVQQWLGSS